MFIILLTSLAISQESKTIKYQKQIEIDFEALDITGEMIKPQGTIIIERQNTKFPPLLQPRLDFDAEMTESVKYIK